ncbi:hypothetical protein M1432_00415 [Patescibacteria group bacterium]|nr:hypothetical protein [Patescibacteria group bacterium]
MTREGRWRPKPEHLLWAIALAVLAVGLSAEVRPVLAPGDNGGPAGRHLAADLYPLYPGAFWQAETAAVETGRNAQNSFAISGYGTVSKAFSDISNIAAVTTPFENYYRAKLESAGYAPVVYMEAGGPGANQMAYASGTTYVVIGYTTIFHSNVAGPNSPVACPCDTTLKIFSGAKNQ